MSSRLTLDNPRIITLFKPSIEVLTDAYNSVSSYKLNIVIIMIYYYAALRCAWHTVELSHYIGNSVQGNS